MNLFDRVVEFLTITDKLLWQNVFVSSVTIPVAIFLSRKLYKWLSANRPGNLLLKGFRKADEVLIFLSQFSGATETNQKNSRQKFITPHPKPLPYDKNNITYTVFHNIDIVWSESDGKVAADIFNVLGRVGETNNVRMGELIKDWDKRNIPIFTIGGNPKTHDLLNECAPINYRMTPSTPPGNLDLEIDGHVIKVDGMMPFDGGYYRKLFLRERKCQFLFF
jgi:hypothetical protein